MFMYKTLNIKGKGKKTQNYKKQNNKNKEYSIQAVADQGGAQKTRAILTFSRLDF